MQRDDKVAGVVGSGDGMIDELERLAGLRVPHPSWVDARDEIFDLHALRRARQEGSGVLITGESGVGKSALLESVVAAFPRYEEPDRTIVPCLLTVVPPRPTIKATARQFLYSLGDPLAYAGQGDAGQLTDRLLTQLAGCRTELILVDEIGHLVDGRRNDSLESVGDWLKRLADESRAPVVLAGLPRSENLMRANDQLRRRFASAIELRVASLDDKTPDLKSFQAVIKAVEAHLPLPPGSKLYEKETARRLLFATEGRMGHLMALIQRAVRISRRSNVALIGHDVLAQAFKRQLWKAAPTFRNPFCADFNWQRLIGANEPFEPAYAAATRRRSQ